MCLQQLLYVYAIVVITLPVQITCMYMNVVSFCTVYAYIAMDYGGFIHGIFHIENTGLSQPCSKTETISNP